jgi:phosphatidate phosphatase LPIN
LSRPVAFPSLRAASEPPPDALQDDYDTESPSQLLTQQSKTVVVPSQEYSWEWGNFPQPSPVQPGFGSPRAGGDGVSLGRSKTLRASPRQSKRRTHTTMLSLGAFDSDSNLLTDDGLSRRGKARNNAIIGDIPSSGGFGAGGELYPNKSDPTTFEVAISGQHFEFELSVIPEDPTLSGDYQRPNSFFDSAHMDEVEATLKFDAGRVDFDSFMQDDRIVDHPRLVIRWVDDRLAGSFTFSNNLTH